MELSGQVCNGNNAFRCLIHCGSGRWRCGWCRIGMGPMAQWVSMVRRFFLLSYFLVVILSCGIFFIREGRARDQKNYIH